MHTPVAYFNGGTSDIAYENGKRDYQNINRVPVYFANLPVGHGGTYNDDNGGEFAKVGVAWLNWHLKATRAPPVKACSSAPTAASAEATG